MRRAIVAMLATACGLIGAAPLHAADDAFGVWGIVTVADGFGGEASTRQWRYAFDAQYRYLDRNGGVEALLLRPALGMQVNRNWSVFAGYAYLVAEPFTDSNREEHRLWQQAAWTVALRDQTNLRLRTWLEQRWLDAGDDVGFRLRQQIQWSRPMPGNASRRLILSLEPFFNIGRTDWGAEPGLAQLRAYFGVSLPLNDRITLETGYMPQLVRQKGATDLLNHVISFNFRM